jgi:hypothetical protein
VPKYVFTLGGFHVYTTMANTTDTDWVYFTITAGKKVFGPRHEKIGDVSDGDDRVLDWQVGPLDIADSDQWSVSYQIVNNGHDDAATQAQKDQNIAKAIEGAATGAIGGANPVAGAIVGAIATVVNTFVDWFIGQSCDGVVLSDTLADWGGALELWTSESLHYQASPAYFGPNPPSPVCGEQASYTVTWGVDRKPEWHAWGAMGGEVTAAPALTSPGPNLLDLFVRGMHDNLWHTRRENGQWGHWHKIADVFQGPPAAIARAGGKLDVFALNGQNHVVWTSSEDGTNWTGWHDMGGPVSSPPAVSSWAMDRLDVFAKGMDNQLWHVSKTGEQPWGNWKKIIDGTFLGAPAAVSRDLHRIDVFVLNHENHIVHASYNDATKWSAWNAPMGMEVSSSPTVTSWGKDRLDLFAKGKTDNALYHRSWANDQWGPWQKVVDGAFVDRPAATSWGFRRIDVVARGTGNSLMHAVYG